MYSSNVSQEVVEQFQTSSGPLCLSLTSVNINLLALQNHSLQVRSAPFFCLQPIEQRELQLINLQEKEKDNTTTHELDYTNVLEDLNPVNFSLTPDRGNAHGRVILPFGYETLHFINANKSPGQELRLDYICVFQPHSFRT